MGDAAQQTSAEFNWPSYTKAERQKIDNEYAKPKDREKRQKKYDDLMRPFLGESTHMQRIMGIFGKQPSMRDEAWTTFYRTIVAIILAIAPQLYDTIVSFGEKVEYQYKTCHTVESVDASFAKEFDGFTPHCTIEPRLANPTSESVGIYANKDEEGRCIEFYSTIYEEFGTTSGAFISNLFFLGGILLALYFCYQRYYELENICITFHYKATIIQDRSLQSKLKSYVPLFVAVVLFVGFKLFYNPKSYETVALVVTNPTDPFCENLKSSTFQDDETLDVRCEKCTDWPEQNLLEYRTERRDIWGELFSTLVLCYVWYEVASTSSGYYGFIDVDEYMMADDNDGPSYFNIHELRGRRMTLDRAEDHKYWFKQQAIEEFSPNEEKAGIMMKGV